MSEAALSSSPTKSLSGWWRTFKTGHRDHEGDAATQSGPHLLVPPPQPPGTSGGGSPGRPGLNRSSASSSAVPGLDNSPRAVRRADYGMAIPPQFMDSPIFGAPLNVSLRYANVKISLTDRSGDNFVYGHVPVIIAKCAVFLKQNAREIEGIFRIPGSVRRVRVLQDLFSTPPAFGKDLDWNGFTVHDAANLLKRYLAMLPEPIIPRSKYAQFREPLQTQFTEIRDYMTFHAVAGTPGGANHMAAAAAAEAAAAASAAGEDAASAAAAAASAAAAEQRKQQQQSSDGKSDTTPPKPSDDQIEAAVAAYEHLIFALQKSSRQLLLYLIDLLSVFAAQNETNKMTAYNLAAIFQPSVLTIPEHDMKPDESEISRIVIEFLIENSTALLNRVQDKAIVTHELRKASGGDESLLDIEEGASDYSPLDETANLPQTRQSSQYKPPPFMISAPSGGNAEATAANTGSTMVPTHVRRHSKSLSSAESPNLKLHEPAPQSSSPKLGGFLRRQRSSRSSRSSSRAASNEPTYINLNAPSQHHDSAASPVDADIPPHPPRQSTRSPSGGDEDRKSRFRRSLMVLLPGKDSSGFASPTSSRNSSPERPGMIRSPSWFAKISGTSRSTSEN